MQRHRGRGGRAAARKRERRRGNGLRVERVRVVDAPVGPDVVVPSLHEVLASVDRLPSIDDWPAIRRLVIPLLQRSRPFDAEAGQPLVMMVPPGIGISVAAHVGVMFAPISAELLAILRVSESDLVAESMANLLARSAKVRPGLVHHGDVDGVPIDALQTGHAIGSTLVLVPDELARLFGPQPRLFIAPMRDLLLGLPPDVDPGFAAWIFAEIASQDPNALVPVAFAFDGRRVTPMRLDMPDAIDALVPDPRPAASGLT